MSADTTPNANLTPPCTAGPAPGIVPAICFAAASTHNLTFRRTEAER